jgi:serine/threonine protein phosphatase PrpC
LQAFFAVSDGHGPLGGCSEDVLSLFLEYATNALEALPPQQPLPSDLVMEALRTAVTQTDTEICQRLQQNVERILKNWLTTNDEAQEALKTLGQDFFQAELSSGATMTALLQIEGAFYTVHVGDSQIFWLPHKEKEIRVLTEDHSWVEDQDTEVYGTVVYKHNLAVARAFGHPRLKKREDLTAAPDIARLEGIRKGDHFVVSSDGLLALIEHNGLSVLQEAIDTPSPRSAAMTLLQASQEIATDNLSIIVIRYRDHEAEAAQEDQITQDLHVKDFAEYADFQASYNHALDQFPTTDLSESIAEVQQLILQSQREQATLELDSWSEEEDLSAPKSSFHLPTPAGLPSFEHTEEYEIPPEEEHLLSPFAAPPSSSHEALLPPKSGIPKNNPK